MMKAETGPAAKQTSLATKEDRRRALARNRQRRRRARTRKLLDETKEVEALCQRLMLIQIWQQYPKDGFSYTSSKDPNINYGSCDTTLRFAPKDQLTVKPGRLSLGLVYDNGHTSKLKERFICLKSEKNFIFLSLIKQYLCRHYPTDRHMMECMRVGCVQGAMTVEHNDTMRGATPTYMFIQPGSNFQLRVRQFPRFKVSVVLHMGVPCIPHQFREGLGLTVIQEIEGDARYVLLPQNAIDNLLPYGNINSSIVVGIKEGMVQVIPSDYHVFHSTRDMKCVSFQDLLAEASGERVRCRPRYVFKYIKQDSHCNREFLWMKAHKWQSGSNFNCGRIYAFFRAVREETTSARLVTHSSGAANYKSEIHDGTPTRKHKAMTDVVE